MKTAITLMTMTGLLAMGGNAASQLPGPEDTARQPAAPKITVTPSGRITAPPVDQMNEEQKRQYEAAVRGFGGPAGPRMPLINSPEVANAWQGMQNALAKSALPG